MTGKNGIYSVSLGSSVVKEDFFILTYEFINNEMWQNGEGFKFNLKLM